MKTALGDFSLEGSFAQEALWALEEAVPSTCLSAAREALVLRGALDYQRLSAALRRVMVRHEALRTTLWLVEGQVQQRVQAPAIPVLPVVELQTGDREPSEAPSWVQRWVDALHQSAPLGAFRACLVRVDAETHLLLATIHLAVYDQWSRALFWRELAEGYGGTAAAKPVPFQYGDYAAWQRKQVSSGQLARDLAFWDEALRGVTPVPLSLEGDSEAPAFACHTSEAEIEPRTWSLLEELASDEEVPRLAWVATIFQLLLARLTGHLQVAVAIPSSGRDAPGSREVIGRFSSFVTLVGELSPKESFRATLARAAHRLHEALRHRQAPFEWLVSQLRPEAPAWSNPWSSAYLSVREAPTGGDRLDSLAVSRIDLVRDAARHPLELYVTVEGSSARLRLLAQRRHVSRVRAEELVAGFVDLAENCAISPGVPIGNSALPAGCFAGAVA